MSRRLLIVGGVAGGATAAARARRLDEQAEIIMFERGRDVSFANCGLPYHVGGEISSRRALLVQTKVGLTRRFNLDIRTRTEVTRIDREKKLVHARDLESGREYTEHYDDLLLSPGAAPFVPPVPGVDHSAVHTLRNMGDMDGIKRAVDAGAKSAVVVGAGFIGLEMAENLRRRGLAVAVVELLPQVMPPLDAEVAASLHQEIVKHGVHLRLGTRMTAIEDSDGRPVVCLESGDKLDADLVILAVGVRPESDLARDAGLEVAASGAIVVDEYLRTSDPHIYAVGDAIEVRDPILGGTARIPLAGPANRQGRIAIDTMFGRPTPYRGAQGTSVVRVFGLTAAATGASEKVLKRRGVEYLKVYVHRDHHVGYFPGAQRMMLKLMFTPGDGRILGAQIVGGDGVDKRIDVLATAIHAGLPVTELEALELSYAPQYGAAKDPVNIAGYVAANMLRGDEEFVYAEELGDGQLTNWTILDVRDAAEFAAGRILGAVLVPLSELRERWQEIPTDKPIAVYCGVGQRSYYATRVLRHHGLKPRNIAGGLCTYQLVHAPQPTVRPWAPREAAAEEAVCGNAGLAGGGCVESAGGVCCSEDTLPDCSTG
ncbi:MAG: FAD-dependent oxidoreductase [Phycisphaerae bacterium]|nr:FAD-dependent oxidoreductase [Phycisphaerae bacterium]